MSNTRRKFLMKKTEDESGVSVNPDHANNFDEFHEDVVGDEEGESDEEDRDKGKKRRGYDDQEDDSKPPSYMFFDFRKGAEVWPTCCELVDPKRSDELLEKATAAAEEAAKKKKKDDEDETNKKDSGTGTSYSSVAWDSTPDTVDEGDVYKLHPDATFELLKDGSSALVLKPGYRIRLKLNDLQEGGDDAKQERERKAAKSKKRAAQYSASNAWMGGGGGSGGGGGGFDFWDMDAFSSKKWFKEKINEYTVTIDMKLNEEPPRDGISLFQTALIHSNENKRSGKTTLTRSDGECLINQAGGVGLFGTYGDTTRARLEPGVWRRVVVAVRCIDKQNEKGEIRTWVNTEPGVVLKEESIVANERFSIDPDQFFLFSSAQAGMMPGNISIRTIRVEMTFASDKDVRSNRARDKVLSIFDEERKKEAAEQRKGLCLAGLFPKPRPMWMAPAFVAAFGDAFVEKSTLEGSSNLAWSYSVINYALQRMLKNPLFCNEDFGLNFKSRIALSDSLHIMQQSAVIFKLMVRMLKTPTESQLLSFLRKLKKFLLNINTGEALLLPAFIESKELIILLERNNERVFKVVIIQTDPYSGLRHHTTSPAALLPHITYRTCMVLNDVPKKNVLDDVFWMALYNMAIHHHEGDTDKFYDVLLPFLTGKPLETSLVEAENAATAATTITDAAAMGSTIENNTERNPGCEETKDENTTNNINIKDTSTNMKDANIKNANIEFMPENCGEWRLPQRSNTAYVRCTLEAFNFLLRRRQVTPLQAKQIQLCLCSELVRMMQNDLHFMLPNKNGVRVCSLAIKELSHMAVQLVDDAKEQQLEGKLEEKDDGIDENDANKCVLNSNLILNEVYELVQSAEKALSYCRDTDAELPPTLDLTGPKSPPDSQDPCLTQYADVPVWDVINTDSDPGQTVALQKYVPVDLLSIPKKATTLEEAVTAIRTCDRQCSLIENQSHCIKNKKFLIVSAIEHVFTQVIPVPKPRGIGLNKDDIYRTERSQRRTLKKQNEEKMKFLEKKKRIEEREEKIIAAGGTIRKSKISKKVEVDNTTTSTTTATPVKCFGTEILPDFEEGKKIEAEVTEEDCIWDRPIHYELQVELLLTLQRLCEHFVAGAMSLVQTRTFDATGIIVTGCITALTDAIIRKIAVDEPSEVCSHLLGRTVSGRQLGHPGYGISISTFAHQCETLEIHTPELSIARTAILDYFQSPNQRRYEKIFSWEEEYILKPGKNLIKYLRLVSKEIGLPIFKPHHLLLDGAPMTSNLMKNYPELQCYRDIVFFWKYLLNTDRKAFKNYVTSENTEVDTIDRMRIQLNFSWDESKNGYAVTCYEDQERIYCRPDPNQINPLTGKIIPIENLPLHRYLSTATPSFYIPPPLIKTEDDVIYRPNLPNFEDKYGQVLNQRDSELLVSYLTVPYMRIPLILAFFASEDRIHKLQSPELRLILDSVMFEPGKYLRMDMCNVEPMMVPTPHPELLASPYGLLLNELCRSPETVIRSVVTLLRGALACDTGAVVDEDSASFNTSSTIIIYCTRLGARLDNYLSFLIDYTEGTHECIDWPLRETEVSPETLSILKDGRTELRELLSSHFHPLFEDYLRRLDYETVNDPTNEVLIDRNSRLACDLHAHMLLIYRNYLVFDMTADVAKVIIGSFIYLTTRHTWNKVTREEHRIHLPETELYSLLQVQRRRVVEWLGQCKQGILDEVMQTALQISSSLTGSFKASADILDAQNRWSRIQGDRSVGRWAVGSTRNVATNSSKNNLSIGAGSTSMKSLSNLTELDSTGSGKGLGPNEGTSTPRPGLHRQHSFDNAVSEIADTGMLGVEIDVQIGQMTLRSKHLAALITEIANHPDVQLIFGETTMQASLVESAEHRAVYRLVGLNHELHYWKTSHAVCPPLGDEWDREYDPADLADSEKWMAALFEPVRRSFFDGPAPPPMQFMMTEKPAPADAEVAVILGLHQTIGGPWKLVYLFRRLRCVHVYECVTQGREWFYTLHLSTDNRYALRDMQPGSHHRDQQYPEWWIRGAGTPYPTGLKDHLSNDVTGASMNPAQSVLVVREQQHNLNISGGRETLVPSRLLYGVVPHALLDAYRFWEDESMVPRGTRPEDIARCARGYKRLLGYPIDEDGEHMIVVEFGFTGSWTDFIPPSSTGIINSANVLQSTGFPGRTVRITKKLKKVMIENFQRRQRIAAVIDSLKVLVPPVKVKKTEENEGVDKEEMLFKVDQMVECNYEGKDEYWPCVVRRVNDDNTYDLEYVLDYKWLGVQRGTDPALVQKRGEGEKKRRGEGVWHWEGMSESEADDWRENSDKEDEVESYEDKEKKQRMTFNHFDELNTLLEAAGGDEEECIAAVKQIGQRFPMPTYTDLGDLCKAVKAIIENKKVSTTIGPPITPPLPSKSAEVEDAEDMVLLNLLYAPRRSRLHSILKVLTRIETAGHILAWTKASALEKKSPYEGLVYGCPSIDLIELPRLKLAFTARKDHEGILRLYSVDHVDLFISNETSAMTAKMLAGIPHSLILSNVRGETQVLVPVIPPIRPQIYSEPFSTFIVLDRSKIPLAERFFLYPVHISFSFLLTKGLNSALYLMLLRFLHRDYADVFRLSDSIATDTKLNEEGLDIFKSYKSIKDDWHPDAHACRLKISLVTIDSGMKSPWDLTIECARHSVKLDCVSSSCRMAAEEELQLLESDMIVLSTTSKEYNKDIHDEYTMALCYNRQQVLRAQLQQLPTAGEDGVTVSCRAPPRALSTGWPFYQDNTVFGENYMQMREVTSVDDGEHSWELEVKGGDETDAPEGGWLVVAVFHTLWSAGCIKVLPLVTELVPMYQNMLNFVSVKADCQGMVGISKSLNITEFPTFILFRGGKEIERLCGHERVVEKLVRCLGSLLTPADKAAHAKHRHRIRLEQALEQGLTEIPDEEVVEERGQLDWTFDPEQCGESMMIENNGMLATLTEEQEKDDTQWEYTTDRRSRNKWTPFPPKINHMIEKCYKDGDLYDNGFYGEGYEIYTNNVEISDYEVSGFDGYDKDYNDIYVRRIGDRCSCPNEEQFLTKEQKDRDKRSSEWRAKLQAYKQKLKEQRIGKDIEVMRGTISFLPNTGIHYWTFRWNHEPSRGGKSDAFGICSDAKEDFSAGPTPRLGGKDTGISLGLYADGSLYHNDVRIHQVVGTRNTITTTATPVDDSTSIDIVKDETVSGAIESKESDTSKEDNTAVPPAPVDSTPSKNKTKTTQTKPKACLFGRKSIVRVDLDTGLDGGTVTFTVDGKVLEDIVLKDVYAMLGCAEIFPVICLSPLDPLTEKEQKLLKKQQERAKKAAMKKKNKGEEREDEEQESDSEEDSDDEDGDEESDTDEEEDEREDGEDKEDKEENTEKTQEETKEEGEKETENKKKKKKKEVVEVEFDLAPSVTLLSREEEEKLNAPPVETAPVLPADAAAVDSNEGSKPPVPSEGETAESKETTDAAKEEKTNETEEDEENKDETPVEEVVDVPVERVRWMYETSEEGWKVYSVEASRELEEATRDGKAEHTLTLGKSVHKCKLETKKQTRDDADGEFRIRRHVVGEGLAGMWEILTMKYERPSGLYGLGVLKTLEKVWAQKETMSGHQCGLGFMFLYSLFTGESRCKVSGGSYGEYGSAKSSFMGPFRYGGKSGGGGGSSSNDSHRFALLLTQLYTDKHMKSLPASVINVLGRNRQVSLRMPKFKDTRKAQQTAFFNGWVDDQEPRSPLADLFTKLVPMMSVMKRKGAFHFPPPPPHLELPSPPSSGVLQSSMLPTWVRPELSDYGCENRTLSPIPANDIAKLLSSVQYRLSNDALRPMPPVHIEDAAHFDELIKAAPEKLYIVYFHANWCGPCKSLAPVYRVLSLQTPTAQFFKIDIDEVDELVTRFEIDMLPTVLFLRGSPEKSSMIGCIKGGGPDFLVEFPKMLSKCASEQEHILLKLFQTNTPGKNIVDILSNLSCNQDQIEKLAFQPLKDCNTFVTRLARSELGMKSVNPELAFDINKHEAAQTAPAVSVLTRFQEDVSAYATYTNTAKVSKIVNLSDKDVHAFFHIQSTDSTAHTIAETKLTEALHGVRQLIHKLYEIRDADARMVQDTIPMLECAANWVPPEKATTSTVPVGTSTGSSEVSKPATSCSKTRFLLNRIAGQNAFVWVEFLFGMLLSSKGEQDLLQLNPYLSADTLTAIMHLITMGMLRANRLGHTNRCIGTAISLESLLAKSLKVPLSERAEEGKVLIPKLVQVGEELAKTITLARHYVTTVAAATGLYSFDPRYLVFEFVWNIQLRQKQVEIVNDFRNNLAKDVSKVKQMIMGAGKTSVVAPLLALIVADGKSLVLSVVPKALVEMSRTRMRETFAAIMVKRIYTLDFDRSTTVTPSMRRSLENAAANRGVVVATPTTLKSIMLSYIETLQQIREAKKVGGMRMKLQELTANASELAKILALFKEGVMLLDEVDLILHPLKSELNFPIGDKFDLDGSEEGERWGLPIHLLDALFYHSTGRVSTFEQRGVALDILKRISTTIQQGIQGRHLQRLPHVTLLNYEFYNERLKPVMAEWAYLWLQKHHLHGIDRHEAVQYLLEGAAARSDTATKITMIELAIEKNLVSSGQMSPGPVPTRAHLQSMTEEELTQSKQTLEELRMKAHFTVDENHELEELLAAQGKQLMAAKEAAVEHQSLVNAIYELDEQIEEGGQQGSRKLAEVQGAIITLHKKIAEIECPRDDSLDNSIIVWYSQAFAIGSSAISDTGSGGSSGDSSIATICSLIEDMGMTLKRCCDPEEAVSRARDLQEEGLLRCLIVGGEERGMSCGPSCVKKHTGLECLKCGNIWEDHSGHECHIGGRGTWAIEKTEESEKKINTLQMMKSLTDVESAYARAHAPLPATRTAIYSAHSSMKEEERMDFWKLGTTVTDDSKQLLAWVNAMPSWKSSQEDETSSVSGTDPGTGTGVGATDTNKVNEESKPFTRPLLRRQSSNNEKTRLIKYKEELEVLEAKKALITDEDEGTRKKLLLLVTEKHALLETSVLHRINILTTSVKEFEELIEICQIDSQSLQMDAKQQYIGPHCGRDAALAMGWMEIHRVSLLQTKEQISNEHKNAICRYSNSVHNELSFLKQMALAAKVVAHVTSPMHKKLLNLCYNWLSTFLPHCLAKVNRVSFGLLSMEDCKAALLADPHVPRSRLKLGVPFVGKDVPSKSSEFAHPDVIIGLTVLAFRYTGLRRDDFVDIIDSMTSQFTQEIGPARDRESSQRHEKWVFAAGGAIRGLKATREGQPWSVSANATQEELSTKEVVQLKFLQKSNKEQMDKLFELIRYEPLVIHHYLQRTIFPLYMRSQRMKISASGQAVGGDMLVGKRVGFSGTPSDLLPQELGRCDYETGDDGMMLTTCLDRDVTSYEFIQDQWTVELLLARIATAESPRYHALIDTGALITGYSNQEVAKELLDRGLSWCEGVVFLDDEDKQQVLVRATGRVVSADQCGVSLERRFAFYDQIHTTGMDIKHVVNATAVITLGKDMVFRDYVQGAYRMRGIGVGQKVHVYVIPEVKELMQRELREATIPAGSAPEAEVVHDHVLEDVVAWLVVNSLRSEQTQWTMLCLQNIGNLYRKNAFKCLTAAESDDLLVADPTTTTAGALSNLSKESSLKVFDESIDFSLEAGVPDPLPFEKKLRSMLDEHEAFLLPEQHKIGHSIMEVVGQFSMIEGSANRLDTEQEREQEQEQEKEVEARRDQQIEVEKFVDREFSRQEEVQRPWAFSTLAQPLPALSTMSMPPDHPFYRLKDFKLRHHEPLEFPESLLVSSNYFNPNWTGLRRVKNVVMVLEFAPSTNTQELRLKTQQEDCVKLTDTQLHALQKAHSLLGFHANLSGHTNYLAREDIRHAIQAFTDEKPTEAQLDSIITQFGKELKGFLSFQEFQSLLVSGILHPQHIGRYYVAVSLAEAETIRRILHIRKRKDPSHVIPHANTELALRYSPMSSPTAPIAGDGGIIFDASHGWQMKGTTATPFEAAVAHSSYRFFDCDMHFPLPALNVLVRSLHGSTRDRERFFFSTIGCRRRMERKWQETPLAKVFTVPDQWAALKQQAQAVFIIEALKARNLTLWEAFSAFDYDNNGILAPSEFYGALRWLGVPNLTAEDVVDFIEAADTNNDGMVDYKEYMDMLSFAEEGVDSTEEEKGIDEAVDDNRVPIAKVEPYGAEVLREIMVYRRQQEQARIREERLRKQAYHDALDVKVFEEELDASKLRKGGANPAVSTLLEGPRCLSTATTATDENKESILGNKTEVCVTDFRFSTNQHPLRFVSTGKSSFIPIHFGTPSDPPVKPMRCMKNHALTSYSYYWMDCERCHKRNTQWCCWPCYKFFCASCFDGDRRSKELDRRDSSKHPTFLRCMNACSFTLQVPLAGGADASTGNYTLTMEARFEKLPAKGAMQSLLRFSLPDLNQARKMHRTSVYLNGDGFVVGRPIETGGGVEPPAPAPAPDSKTEEKDHKTEETDNKTEETDNKTEETDNKTEETDNKTEETDNKTERADVKEKPAKKAPPKKPKAVGSGVVKVRPGRWAVISISVEPEKGILTAYVDGKLCHVATDLDPSDLRLHHKVVVLGGGKQAHMRGGDLRRIVLHSAALHGDDVGDLYHRLANDHPAIGGHAVRIQALYRGRVVRKKWADELKKTKPDKEGDEEEEGSEESEESEEEEEEY